MNKRIIGALALLMALCVVPAMAQRNLAGEKSVSITAGWVDGMTFKNDDKQYRYNGSIGYMVTVKNHHHWKFAANYLQKDYGYRDQVIPKAQFTGEAGFFTPIVGDRRRYVSLNAGLSVLAGYETSNWGGKLLHDGATLRNGDCFIYGGALTAEVESYLTDRIILTFNVRQNVLFGSKVGNWHTLLGLGVRIVIN